MDRKTILLVMSSLILLIISSNLNTKAINENFTEGNFTASSGSNYSGFNASIISLLDYNYIEYPSNAGIYQVQSSQPITLVILYYNASGFTYITPSSALGESHETVKAIGDLFIVVDGEVSRVTGFTEHAGGFTLQMPLSQGKHFISIVYTGKDDVDGFVYSYDTILVDVRVDSAFTSWNLSLMDTLWAMYRIGSANQVMNHTIALERDNYAYGVKDYIPRRDFANGISINILEFSNITNSIKINMSINSTGSSAYQVDSLFYSTLGNVFLFDQIGIYPVFSTSQLTVLQGNANYGVLLFRDAGINSVNTTQKADWEGFGQYEINNLECSFDFDVDQVSLDETSFDNYVPPVSNTSTPTETTPTPTPTLTPTDTVPIDTTTTDTTPDETTPTDIPPSKSSTEEPPTFDFLPLSNYWVLGMLGLVVVISHRRKRL